MQKVLLAGLFHETHTFLEGTTSLQDFQILRGEELLQARGDSSPLGGVLEVAAQLSWQVIPTVDFRATPSATVDDDVVETFWQTFKDYAEPALDEGVSAIYLILHGAMVSQTIVDVEGEILQRIRGLAHAQSLPVFGVLDLHANFTARMAQYANCLVSYRHNPHTDARHVAETAALLLDRCLKTRWVPKMFWHHPPLMWPPTGTGTEDEPMKSLETLARRLEGDSDEVWAVNVLAGFSFADTPDTGVSCSIVTTGSEEEARAKLAQLSLLALALRERGNVVEPSLRKVMQAILPVTAGPVLLVEPADNIGGGAPGDGTAVLRALLDYGVQDAAVIINDPEAVTRLRTLFPGQTMTLAIGGKGSRLDHGPMTLTVEFVSTSDGHFVLEDSQSHLASLQGSRIHMGRCTVVRHEGVTILLTSKKTPPFDLGQWRSQGIEPTSLGIIGVKAAVAHRRAYDPIAKASYTVDTPGPCSSDLRRFPYRRIRRPIYPLDEVNDYV
jgi:microcystin degradation protein MlrC